MNSVLQNLCYLAKFCFAKSVLSGEIQYSIIDAVWGNICQGSTDTTPWRESKCLFHSFFRFDSTIIILYQFRR